MSTKPTEYEAYHDVQIFADLCAIFEQYIPQSSTLQNTEHEIMITGLHPDLNDKVGVATRHTRLPQEGS